MTPVHQSLKVRALVLKSIREFFWAQEFLEVDTPSLVFSPGMEPHIRPWKAEGKDFRGETVSAFLPTSPEFAMKRVLSRGFHRIFQICKAYRAEPLSSTHNPEFTILEWYRGNSDYFAIMNDVENLMEYLNNALQGQGLKPQASRASVLRISVKQAFQQYANIDLAQKMPALDASPTQKENFNDDFFRVMLNQVEPALAALNRPVILHDYPHTQAALSNLYEDEAGCFWAKRFEVYAGGLELANAFDELCDSQEQRRRFEADMALRAQIYGAEFPPAPLDEDFLTALQMMPATGGIALGVDRLVMYFCAAQEISEVLWLPSKL